MQRSKTCTALQYEMFNSEACQNCIQAFELCQALPRRILYASLHEKLHDHATYTAALSHTHMWMASMEEADGRRGMCNCVAQCVASHLQLGPADVTPHVDRAAADGVAAVLKHLVQRRQHWRLTGLHVENELQQVTYSSELSWQKLLSECP